MTAAVPAPEPFTAVSRAEARPDEPPAPRRDDGGAFRAAYGAGDEHLVLRPGADGLRIERSGIGENVAWDDVTGVSLASVAVGALSVPVARVRFRRGPSLDLADAIAAGADDLPERLAPDAAPLVRVERMRLFAAAVIAAAGLAPRERFEFHRGGRGGPPPELTARPRRLRPWAAPVLVVVSILLVKLLFPALSWGSVVAIHAALLVHELGHAAAMRLTGTEVRSIVVLPGLGAATRAEHPFRTRWADLLVALAGPVTGVPLAIATLAIWQEPPPEPVRWALVVAVAFNLLNLLPFAPLDGGRVLVAMLAGAPRAARLVLAWVPVVVALAVVWIAGPGDTRLGLLLLLAVALVFTRLTMRRMDLHQWVFDAGFDPAALRAALRDVTWGLGGAARDDVDGGVPATPMTQRQAILAGLAFFAVVSALAASTAALVPLVPEFRLLFGTGEP